MTTHRIRLAQGMAVVALGLALVTVASPGADADPPPQIAPSPQGRPMYYTRKIKDKDLQGRNLRELALLRNTIFARAGNPFRRHWLHDYFVAQPWYHPLPAMDASKLSKVDKANAEFIVRYQGANVGFSFDAEKPDGQEQQPRPLQVILDREKKTLIPKAKAGQATPDEIVELQLLSAREGQWLVPDNVTVAHRSPMEDFRLLDKQLSVGDLADLSRRDLRILRNAVYARHGYTFKSPVLAWYFQTMTWYQPNPKYKPAMLSEVENRNVKLIRSVEDSLGGPLKDRAQAEQEGEEAKTWLYGA